MIRLNLIGLVIYHVFLVSDYRAIGDAFTVDLIVHFLIMTPLGLAVNRVLAGAPPAWLRESIEALSVIALAATIVWVSSSSQLPDRDLVLSCNVLVVLFSVMMQRIRFWYVVAAGVAIQAFHTAGLLVIFPDLPERAMMSFSVSLGVVLFSLLGAYRLEHDERLTYLLRLRDELRRQDLERMSLRDALTGISNRHALDLALARLAGSGRMAGSTAILLMDIDGFKLFNDTNGHVAGDVCLKRIAGLIAGSIRLSDADAYRYGGEEFLVLLTGTTAEHAAIVGERVRSAVEGARIPRDPSATAFVTLSIGVACGQLGLGATPASLIADADGALYGAKRNGRNCVAFAAAPVELAA